MAGSRRGLASVPGATSRLAVALLAVFVLGGTHWLGTPRVALAAWEAEIYVDYQGGSGSGWITTDDGAIECRLSGGVQTGDCSETYILADFVDAHYVNATYNPDPSSTLCFDIDCIPNGESRGEFITLTRAQPLAILGAGFILRTFQVSVDTIPSGGIAVIGNVTSCPSLPTNADVCWQATHGTEITVLAKAGFSYWSGPKCNNSTNTACTFTVTDSVQLKAYFGLARITASPVGGGEICATAGGTLCTEGVDGSVTKWITEGNTLALEARARSGWRFKSWSSGPCAGQDWTCSFVVAADATITATFVQLATPPPPTPKPTAKPTVKPTARPSAPPPTVAPAQTSPPASTGTPAVLESAEPSPTMSDEPGSSAAPSAEPVATVATSSAAPSAPSSAPAEPAAPVIGAGPGPDPVLLALFGIGLLLVLIVGFALGRRRGPSPTPDQPAPH